jgi:hypothetical protein
MVGPDFRAISSGQLSWVIAEHFYYSRIFKEEIEKKSEDLHRQEPNWASPVETPHRRRGLRFRPVLLEPGPTAPTPCDKSWQRVHICVLGRQIAMAELSFEWDEAKNAANVKNHGIDFLDAALIFDNPTIEAIIAHHQRKESNQA